MKSRHTFSALTLAILSVAAMSASAQSSAQYQEPGFFYGGVSAGESRAKVDEAGVANNLLGANGPATGFSSDEKDTAYKLFGGYQFNRNIALEGGYYDLGKTSFSSTTPAGAFNNSTRRHGLNLDLVGTLPITERFSMLGRVGAAHGRTQSNYSGAGATAAGVQGSRDSKTDVKVGLGVQYELNRSMWLRAEIERYRVKTASAGRTNVDVVTVGLVFPFNRAPAYVAAAPAPYVAPAPAPAPIVQAPAPAPAPMPAPAPAPMPQRVSMSAESLFGFDASTVKPEGRAELDKFARDLSSANYQTVTVEGHTDRLGSDSYNQKLSEQRATAVKNYLVTSGKLDGSKISAVGKGETMPVTKPGDCKGTKRTAALVACLQPDRRVDVEVTGTR
ncbi:OmpA family protein [Hydrogenophaga sp.]|uniref:OmpA family protein n=1 Tax=Hydrogenophaga sp. TaxID=1904254 RepID=UPI0025B96AB3|nr:OmpA family protein [Hydrogenophaga sp.]MBT9465038.1 OmpA family protein [Hydrogenophaga sp.]